MNNSQIKQNDFDIVYSFPSSFLKLDYAYQTISERNCVILMHHFQLMANAYQEKCQAIYNREFGFQ